MKKILAIILPLLIYAEVTAQSASLCQRVKELMSDEQYRMAYRELVISGESSCGGYVLANVLKANGRYEEALEALSSETGNRQDELRKELQQILGIGEEKTESYGVRLIDANDSLSSLIFMVAGSPILLIEATIETDYFPHKKEAIFTYELTADSNSRQILPIEYFTKLKDKNRVELGPATSIEESIFFTARYDNPVLSGKRSRNISIYELRDGKSEMPEWIDPEYNYMHPAVSNDGWLYFSSDIPGGRGGMDLWKVNLEVEDKVPMNCGDPINSSSDEVYPALAGDSLYFATNDPNRSVGGFDIVFHYQGEIINPGPPLNSPYHEFNPYTDTEDLAYIISNRFSASGVDRLVFVTVFKSKLLFDLVRGRLEGDKLEAGDRVNLYDSNGHLIDYTYMDENGEFAFAQIKGMENYSISLDEESSTETSRLLLFDSDYNLVNEIVADESGQFRFELLTPENYILEKQSNSDDSVLALDIAGMFDNAEKGPIPGVEIVLQDAEGNDLGRAFTDAEGKFIFEQTKPDISYKFQTSVVDPNAQIRIFNDEGEVIEVIEPDQNDGFVYVRLKETDKVITITNDQDIQVRIAESEVFKVEAIYYELDEIALKESSEPILKELTSILRENEDLAIVLSGHTDSRGDADYNLELSKKRIKSVEQYLIQNGIGQERIVGDGYGETKPVNHCKDGVECSEEEHAQNRRTEIQFFVPEKL